MSTFQLPRILRGRRRPVVHLVLSASLVTVGLVAGALTGAPPVSGATAKIVAVGAENEYANVLAQIGGKYVSVTSILDNPNTDPHTFEASPRVAEVVSEAELVVQNGVGYDGFMNKIEAASPNATRKVIVAQHVLGTADRHAEPAPVVQAHDDARRGQGDGEGPRRSSPRTTRPTSAPVSRHSKRRSAVVDAIAAFKAKYAGTPVAATEPVADYLLQAMGAKILTPFVFQADIMNGVDPVAGGRLARGRLLHQAQGEGLLLQPAGRRLADDVDSRRRPRRPACRWSGVYETMPTPGYDYQTWMQAEVDAIEAAVVHGTSTEKL